jgi:hypothetical protein
MVDSLTGAPATLPRRIDLESPEAKIQNVPIRESWLPPRHGAAAADSDSPVARNTSGPGRGLGLRLCSERETGGGVRVCDGYHRL